MEMAEVRTAAGDGQNWKKQLQKQLHMLLGPTARELMFEASPLTQAEREVIAAYTSGLNECGECYEMHKGRAVKLGIDPVIIDQLVEDLETTDYDERMKPILRYVRRLTQDPASVTPEDLDQIRAAGWDAGAMYHVISICALLNYTNRLLVAKGLLEAAASGPASS